MKKELSELLLHVRTMVGQSKCNDRYMEQKKIERIINTLQKDFSELQSKYDDLTFKAAKLAIENNRMKEKIAYTNIVLGSQKKDMDEIVEMMHKAVEYNRTKTDVNRSDTA